MNLPNRLTVARIGLIFVALALANVEDKLPPPQGYALRIAVCVIALAAGLTDLLDGYLARRNKMVTSFGKLMDPLADKIFVTACLLVFVDAKVPGHAYEAAQSILPGWVAVVILSREFLVTGLRSLAAGKGEIVAADKWGKAKTASQMVLLSLAAFIWIKLIPVYDHQWLSAVWTALIWMVTAFTVFSGAHYFIKYRHLYMSDC